MYASKTSFGSPDEGSPSPGPESLYGSRQGLQVEERHQLAVEEQMVEEDERKAQERKREPEGWRNMNAEQREWEMMKAAAKKEELERKEE